jgi:hypothetical protein
MEYPIKFQLLDFLSWHDPNEENTTFWYKLRLYGDLLHSQLVLAKLLW